MSDFSYDATIEHAGGLVSKITLREDVADDFYVGIAQLSPQGFSYAIDPPAGSFDVSLSGIEASASRLRTMIADYIVQALLPILQRNSDDPDGYPEVPVDIPDFNHHLPVPIEALERWVQQVIQSGREWEDPRKLWGVLRRGDHLDDLVEEGKLRWLIALTISQSIVRPIFQTGPCRGCAVLAWPVVRQTRKISRRCDTMCPKCEADYLKTRDRTRKQRLRHGKDAT